jgi:thiol-disulfide isomerase/thioredoxin
MAVGNPAAEAPIVHETDGVRYVEVSEAPEVLLLDSVPPDEPSRLLWFRGKATHPLVRGGVVALDGAGGIIRIDERLRVHRIRADLEGRSPISVAPDGGDGFWVTDATGGLVHVDREGAVAQTGAAPFDYAKIRGTPAGELWAVRSHENWSYHLADRSEPLLVRLNDRGSVAGTLGAIRVPEHVLLAELANAGHLVVDEGVLFFAPFIRDEVIALTHDGDTLWIARRRLPQEVAEPKFVVENGRPMIDYAPVNIGAALGLDGRLYVMSVPGFTTQQIRLDVFDPATGDLLRTARLDGPDQTLAVDAEGRTYALDPFRLMTGVAPREREAFAAFELPLLAGGRLGSADLEGKVTLINFWASWCAPCREEMPALVALRSAIDHPDFAFYAFNDDVWQSDAAAFIDEYGFEFPVVLGGGKLRPQFHYVGLPFTVLLDRGGRVVQRWVGFAGKEQLSGIRLVVQAELQRESDLGGHDHEVHDAAGSDASHGRHDDSEAAGGHQHRSLEPARLPVLQHP